MNTRSDYQTAYRQAVAGINHWLANEHLHNVQPFVDSTILFKKNGSITLGPNERDQEIHREVTFTPDQLIDLRDGADMNVHIVYLKDLHDLEVCKKTLEAGIEAALDSMFPTPQGRNLVRAIHIDSIAKTITEVLVSEDQAVEDAITMIGEGCTEVDAARVFSWGIILRDANQDPRQKSGYFALRGQMGYHVGNAVVVAASNSKARDIGATPENICDLVKWVDRKSTAWDKERDIHERVNLALLYYENIAALAEYLSNINPTTDDSFCHGTSAFLSNGVIVLGPHEWDNDVFRVTHFGASMENFENLTIHTVYHDDFFDIARCVRELHDASTAALDRLFAGVET